MFVPAAAAQTAPTADAGADQTVAEGATVTLDGSGSSDSANRALTYAWSQTGGTEVELSSTGAVRPSFIAPTQLATNATLTFSLTVTAGGTASQPDTVAITVTAGSDDAPTADAGTDQAVYEGATVALDGTGSRDPEGQALTYAWSQTGGTSVTLSSASVVSPTFTAPSSLTATAALTFSLTVTASSTASQPDTATITVPAGSTAPTTTAPTVGSVGFFGSPYRDDTYGVGERISVAVSFNTVVSVVGMPQVALTIGTRTRYATFYHANGRDTYFRYWTQPGDADTDGIAIPQNAVRLNGGAIRDATDTTVNAALTHSAVTADSDRKVNGRLVYPPRQAWVQIMSSPYSGDTYKLAETVTVNVRFNKAVRVIGTPSVELTIGTRKRQARYDSTIYSRVVFTYAVQAADADADGISIDANAIRLNGGAIKDVVATNTDAVLTHTAVAASTSQKVDGSLAPAVSRIRFHPSLLPSGGTYTKGDTMWLDVWFDQAVSVSGSPRLGLQIGSRTRQATGELSTTDAHLMLFSYRVQAGDVDTDGVSIGANALTLNGGSIVSAADGTVNAVLTHDAVAVGRKVDGGSVTAPVVNRMLFNAATAPASGTYTKGTTIWVEVWFDQKVAVSGIPQLGLSIGSRTRQANGQLSTSNAQLVFFSYRVQAGDVDTNGVSIGADALTLNGGEHRGGRGRDDHCGADARRGGRGRHAQGGRRAGHRAGGDDRPFQCGDGSGERDLYERRYDLGGGVVRSRRHRRRNSPARARHRQPHAAGQRATGHHVRPADVLQLSSPSRRSGRGRGRHRGERADAERGEHRGGRGRDDQCGTHARRGGCGRHAQGGRRADHCAGGDDRPLRYGNGSGKRVLPA